MNEDNSKEKHSEGRVGGGWSTIASMNLKRLLHVFSSSEVDMAHVAQLKHYKTQAPYLTFITVLVLNVSRWLLYE